MFEFLKRKYQEGKISNVELEKAVEKGWITQEQINEIKTQFYWIFKIEKQSIRKYELA